jgi:hypothetical protein
VGHDILLAQAPSFPPYIEKNRRSAVFLSSASLLGVGGANRADTRASAAVDAGVFVDDVLRVSGRDAADRAFRFASTTVDAIVVDYVCHFVFLLMVGKRGYCLR